MLLRCVHRHRIPVRIQLFQQRVLRRTVSSLLHYLCQKSFRERFLLRLRTILMLPLLQRVVTAPRSGSIVVEVVAGIRLHIDIAVELRLLLNIHTFGSSPLSAVLSIVIVRT